jgi:WD40 repeat protein
MRPSLAILLLIHCLVIAASAQTARQEKAIDLPAGVSPAGASLAQGASVSREGNLVAAICSDRVVRVWSTRSGELLRSRDENGKPPSAVQFSVDGRLLAVAYEIVQYEKGEISIVDVDSWRVQHHLAAPFTMYALALSPDKRRVAFSDRYTQLWDLTGGNELTDISPPFGGSSSLSFSADGRWVVTADGDGFARVYDTSTGKLRSTVEGFLLEPMAAAFSPDGKSVLVGGVDKTVFVADPETGKVQRTLPKQPGLILSLDVSADGKRAAVLYGSAEHFFDVNHLMLWDLGKGTIIADFQKPGITIVGGSFRGDHYLLATAAGNELTLWSLP